MNTETSSKELITKVPANGYALREQNRYILDDSAIDGVEITFERADEPLRVTRYLDDLQFDYVSIHAMKISVESPDPPRRDYLDALRRIAEETGASSISDHLEFICNGAELGHFSSLPLTEAALDVCSRNIDSIQSTFDPLHYYIENIASQ